MKFKKRLFLAPTTGSSSPATTGGLLSPSGISTSFSTTNDAPDALGRRPPSSYDSSSPAEIRDEDPKLLINEFLDSFVDEDYLEKKQSTFGEVSFSIESPSPGTLRQEGEDDKENVKPSPITSSDASRNIVMIKNYRLTTLLGKGSFGNVVLAETTARIDDEEDDRGETGEGKTTVVAVKILSRTKIIKTRKVHRALTESRCLRLLSGKSPFFPVLLETFKSPTKLYIVQEFIPGGELFKLLERKRRLSLEETRFLAGEILLGLECMHGLEIVYRDLKPENVMITAEGHVKLVDFGLSRWGVKSPFRGATSVVGTVEYIAPEMLGLVSRNSTARRGSKQISSSSVNGGVGTHEREYGTSVDFWSLGMMIAELLLGLPPWYSSNHAEMTKAILRDPVPTTVSTLLLTHFPSAHDLVLNHLLVKDPRRRTIDFHALKRTRFFKPLDFERLASGKHPAPLIPSVSSPRDVSNFDHSFVTSDVKRECYDNDDAGDDDEEEEEQQQQQRAEGWWKQGGIMNKRKGWTNAGNHEYLANFDCDETWEGF